MSIQSNNNAFLLSILKKIESLKEGVICYATEDHYPDGTHRWWWIAVDDYNFYSQDWKYKSLMNAYGKAAKARGLNIAFCYCSVSEDSLMKLANESNLILNI